MGIYFVELSCTKLGTNILLARPVLMATNHASAVFYAPCALSVVRILGSLDLSDHSEWHRGYEGCDGNSQSPINLSAADEQVNHVDGYSSISRINAPHGSMGVV